MNLKDQRLLLVNQEGNFERSEIIADADCFVNEDDNFNEES